MRATVAGMLLGAAVVAAHASQVPLDAVPLGTATADAVLEPMTLVFDSPAREALAALLDAQLDPSSPDYGRWLTPDEFGERFGVARADYDEALAWLEAEGFDAVEPTRGRLAIHFRGTAAQAGQAFATTVDAYAWNGTTRFAPTVPPALPTFGASRPRGLVGPGTFLRVRPFVRVDGRTFLSPRDVFLVHRVRDVHLGGTTGRGTAIAIPAASDFAVSDIETFRTDGSRVTVVKQFVGGTQSLRGGIVQQEVTMDVEWATAIAPGATAIAVIGSGELLGAISAAIEGAIDGNVAPIVSISYGVCEHEYVGSFATMLDNLFMQAAAQGQSVFVSSGNLGVAECGPSKSVNAFAASPWVTGVGGTELDPLFDADGDATGYGGERAWNDASGATAGGFSRRVQKPSWQTGPGVPDANLRGVPDVAFAASLTRPGMAIVYEGRFQISGGTSLAAPAWAGIAALLVEQQGGRLGLLNPELYRLGAAQAGGGPAVFHDVETGHNGRDGIPGYAAGPGYDLTTGWGSFDAVALLEHFQGAPVSCADGLACDDGNPCTADACSDGRCGATALADGSACAFDACSIGSCTDAVCALPDGGGCDDGRACTADLCERDGCGHAPKRGLDAAECMVGALRAPDGPCVGERLPARVATLVLGAGAFLVKTGDPQAGPKQIGRRVRQARKRVRKAERIVRRDRALSDGCRAQVAAFLEAARRDAADLLP